jgi:glucans biosynthesis protein
MRLLTSCRRFRLSLAAILICLLPLVAHGFDFDQLGVRAKKLASMAFVAPQKSVSGALADLTYDQQRDIRFNPLKSTWRDHHLPFELAYFHQSGGFDTPVRIHEIVGSAIHEIPFDAKSFNYGANQLDPKQLKGLGFAGFRVHYSLNTAKYKDEVIAFLGASYFRAVGAGQQYGLSARALAIDTALGSGEEFPFFSEFWIQRPEPADQTLTIYALLNSKRVVGAYRFKLKPGTDTAIDVKARLYLRENITKIGIAPLTSMYFFGENQHAPGDDYRPEVHDSDGLSIHSGTGEWIWRPLINPRRLMVTSYALNNPAGFGLMQRDRNFGSYEDLESHYELRPSAWVEPKGYWGAGRVELVQIPTPDETNDNIVAFWVPAAAPHPGVPFDIEYRLLWQKDAEQRPPLAWVAQTRRGHGWRRKQDDSIAMQVDFEGPALKKFSATEKIEAVVNSDANAKILETNMTRNEQRNGWRMTLRLQRVDEKLPVELRAYLKNSVNTLSETWSYILPPN